MSVNRIVHIGFPKTASTFLQRNVFPYCKNYVNIDFLTCKDLSNKIVIDGVGLDINSIKETLPEGNIIFSYEGLSGSFYNGQGVNSCTTIQNLKKIGFNKVLIVLRKNKIRWMESIYNQYIKTGGRLSFKDFLSNPSHKFQIRQWYPEMMELSSSLINKYKEIFGEDNVCVFYSEDMYSNVDGFKMVLEQFIATEIDIKNEKVNESIPNWAVKILMFTNHFTISPFNPTSIFKFVSIGHIKKILFFKSKSYDKSKII